MDHTLLPDYDDEKSEVELISRVSKLALMLKKEGKMVLFVGQLNDKIEDQERRDSAKPYLHYPTKRDIHGGKSIYQAADCVMILHAPEHLGIEYYGKKKYPTKDLLALHLLKMRNGTPGVLRLKADLSRGNIEQWPNDITTSDYAAEQH